MRRRRRKEKEAEKEAAGAELKTKTPHKDVGKNPRFFAQQRIECNAATRIPCGSRKQ